MSSDGEYYPDESGSPESGQGQAVQWKRWEGVVPHYIRYACFLWQFIKFTFIFYLCARQNRMLTLYRRVPRSLSGKLPPQTFERARDYHTDLNYLEMASCLYWIMHEVWLILLSGFTTMWFISGPILDFLNIWPSGWDQETGESIVFVFVMTTHYNFAPLPIKLFKTFIIEEKFGFNKMTIWDFLWDFSKVWLFHCVYSCVCGVFLLWIVREMGKWFFVWLWIFSIFVLLITLAVYPNFIAPIFDKYTLLREGRLKSRLRRLANFIGFPLEEILVVHQSWRSEHKKAYFFGLLGSKRIVLYDTFLAGYPEADEDPQQAQQRVRLRLNQQQNVERTDSHDSLQSVPSRILERARSMNEMESLSQVPSSPSLVHVPPKRRATMYDTGFTENEIEASVARLMGHWVMGHSVTELIFPCANLFFFFLIFSWVYQNSTLFQAFAVPRGMEKPILLGLKLIYQDVLDIYKIFVENVMRHYSRQRVYETDAFAARLGYGKDLIDGIIEEEKENLDYPYFDSWYWNFHYNEPSALDRIDAIQREMEIMKFHRD